jgi:hypothetical protein
MTGRILFTNLTGGMIVSPDDRRWKFDWRDAIDFGPKTVGHSTRVEFSPGDRQHALSLRLAND